MKKTKGILKISTAAILVSSLFAGCGDNEKNVFVKENFESAQKLPDFVENALFVYSADKVISGKKSILADTLRANKYTEVMKFNVPAGNLAEISFKYKILQAPENTRVGITAGFFNDGKYVRAAHASTPEKFSEYKGVFRVPSDKQMLLTVTLPQGVLAVFDDVKIKTAPADPKADWAMKKESALNTLRHTPFDTLYAKLDDAFLNMSKDEFFPFIDKFGQFKHRNWTGKINSDADFSKRINEEESFLKKNPPFADRDKYFGLIDPKFKFEATGKFRTQKVDGKWFLITPDGNLFWSMGANCAGANGDQTPLNTREHFFDDVADTSYISFTKPMKFSYAKDEKIANFTFFKRNVAFKYGKDFDYNKILARRAASWGMNTYAAWSSQEALGAKNVPFTVFLSTEPHSLEKIDGKMKLHGWWMTPPDFFSPNFEKNAKASAKSQESLLKSPYCIGAFFDNELPWQKDPAVLAKGILSCKATQPAKIAFRNILKDKYSDIASLNKAWESSYKDWDSILAEQDFFPKSQAGFDDMVAFEKRFCQRYFEVCRNAIKAIDKNALYLGCRFGGVTGKLVAPISSHYCDAVTINVYRDGVATLTGGEGAEDKPIIIGEFHFGDVSNGVFGGGLCPTPDTKSQVQSFNAFVKSALANPSIIGTHWFKYSDQPTTGRFDGENFSVGLVDIADTPHYELVSAMREISKDMYSTRLKDASKSSAKKDGVDKNYQ